jgi:hypothetical protein
MFKTVYEVSICVLTKPREIEVTFVRPPLPGLGLTGILWEINRVYPSITVEHWDDATGYTGIYVGEGKDNYFRTTEQEMPLDSISYRLYIPFNFDLNEVASFLEQKYIEKGLSVVVVYDTGDDNDGTRSSKQPVLV